MVIKTKEDNCWSCSAHGEIKILQNVNPKTEEKKPLGRQRQGWECILKCILNK
jgi:hypothetical protein